MPPASAAAASPSPSPGERDRLHAALWRLLAAGARDENAFRDLVDDVDDVLAFGPFAVVVDPDEL